MPPAFPHAVSRRCDSDPARRRALSLAETVAIGVVSIVLMAWLVPAAGSLRRDSKDAHCLNRLGQIGYANSVYAAQDPGDAAIPVHWRQFQQCPGQLPGELCDDPIWVGAYEWGGKSGVGRDEFVTGKPGDPLGSKYGTRAHFGPASRPLNDVLFPGGFADAHASGEFDEAQALRDTQLDLNAYQCPSDTGFTGIHCPRFAEQGLTSFDHFGTSYNANVFMIWVAGGTLAPGFNPSEVGSNSPYLHRVAQLKAPSRTIAFQENNGRFAWAVEPDQPGCGLSGLGLPGTVRGWHGKDWTFNAAFTDGHANTIYMRGYSNNEPALDDPSRQQNSACVIIRGEGWQIDTLPVAFARTFALNTGSMRPSYEDCFPGTTAAAPTETPAAGGLR